MWEVPDDSILLWPRTMTSPFVDASEDCAHPTARS